ncbi:MAG TPA: hypothetical protein VGL93_04545 [Streptosporangiaceae bacterium]|jgi:hypothetical protein
MRTLLRIAAAGAAAVALGGCSLLGAKPAAPAQKDAEGTRPKSAASATAPQPQHVIASQRAALEKDTARVDLTALKQNGGMVTLEFTVTNQTSNDALGIQIGHLFTASGDTSGSGTLSGITLVDGANKKRHLTATDSRGGCVCSQDLSAVFVKTGQTVAFTATFGAPPANTKKVDVQIPRVPVFHDIPIA